MSDSFTIHSLPRRLKRGRWEDLLEGWVALIRRYTILDQPWGKDVPYWYGERALTGLLGAAAWNLPGGWSLEEFTGLRGGRRRRRSGRGDLWFGNSRADYTVEAKVVWPPSTWDYAAQYTKAHLSQAAKQLRSLSSNYRVGTRIALCYVVPELRARSTYGRPKNVSAIFTRLPLEFEGSRYIVASYRRADPVPKHDGRLYPGVILVGHVVEWGQA
jgi:hypothetical protein